jgi:membrane protein
MKIPPVKLLKVPIVRLLLREAHKVVVPGLNGASLFVLGKFFYRESSSIKIRERAAGVTYNFLMAMPPTLLFLFSLLPFLPFNNVEQTIFNIIKLITPNSNIYANVHDVVRDFMKRQRHDVLSYGILLVLYFASNGVMGLIRCFDKTASLYTTRNRWQRRWAAIKLTVMLITVTILALAVLIVQSRDLDPFIHKMFHSVVIVKVLSFIVLIMLVFISISIVYTYGPSLRHRFPFVSVGSVCATLASVVATSVFFFLVNNFFHYNKVYGSIGTLIAFMFWVWLNTIIILLGYTLNVSLLMSRLNGKANEKYAR